MNDENVYHARYAWFTWSGETPKDAVKNLYQQMSNKAIDLNNWLKAIQNRLFTY